jgi:Tfp pilus assembly protein PilO
MTENQEKIIEYNNNIGTLTNAVKELEPEYQKNSKLFHSKKEVEDLYQNISKYALMNGLSITNLKKGEAKGVAGDAASQSTEQTTENDTDQNLVENSEGQQIMYYKIPVDYEIQGNFLSYLKFRRALSKSQKVINFDKEEINVQKEIQGQILSKGTISIVGLPNEYD